MKNALISIIVPVYRVEKYLNRCVDSVLGQTYRNLEIILVDDGSPDTCGKICDEYAKKDSRVKVLHKQNGGLSSARNAGIALAQGEYLFFLDSDDYIAGDCIQKLYGSILTYHSDCSVTAPLLVYEEKGLIRKRYNAAGECGAMSNVEAINTMLYSDKFDVSAWGKLYKRTLFESIRFPDGKFHEDAAIMYKVLHFCDCVSYIGEVKYYYVKRNDGNITSMVSQKKVSDVIETTEALLDYIITYIPDCRNSAVYYLTKVQFAMCIKMQVSSKTAKGSLEHMKANIKKYRVSVICDKRTDIKVKLCCVLSYAGMPLARLLWKLYKLSK